MHWMDSCLFIFFFSNFKITMRVFVKWLYFRVCVFVYFAKTVTLLSKTAGGELWVSIVEKAFATSFGGYDRIDA